MRPLDRATMALVGAPLAVVLACRGAPSPPPVGAASAPVPALPMPSVAASTQTGSPAPPVPVASAAAMPHLPAGRTVVKVPTLTERNAVVDEGGMVHVKGEKGADVPTEAATVAGMLRLATDEEPPVGLSERLVLGDVTVYPPPACGDAAPPQCKELRSQRELFEAVVPIARIDGPGPDTTLMAQAGTIGNICYGGGPMFFLRVTPSGQVTYSPIIGACMGAVEVTRSASAVLVRILAHTGRELPGVVADRFPEERYSYDLASGAVKRLR
jgi:hypothetical protein